MRITNPMQRMSRGNDLLRSAHTQPPQRPSQTHKLAPHDDDDYYNFCNIFIAFAIAKLDLAITCRLSLVTSGSACISLSLFAFSLSSRRMSPPCSAWLAGILSWHTATMLDTIVMICVKFSFSVGDGVGLRTPESTLWIA
jgi:hypothetical protein